jgi:rod shape-determining protein MreC
LRWGFVPAEALHGRGLGDEYTVTLTAGAEAGSRPYAPVVAPEGLVGMVQTVDPSMSQAIVWAHPDFRVSAMAADGNAFGIVKAHQGAGAARWLLEMSGVPFRQQLKPGALIVSSGLGGTYPRGIPVGTVLEEMKTSEGWARTYLLRPAVQPSDITTVMILLPGRVQAGVDGTWKPPVDTTPKPVKRAVVDSTATAIPSVPGAGQPIVPPAAAPGAIGTAPVVPLDSLGRPIRRRRRVLLDSTGAPIRPAAPTTPPPAAAPAPAAKAPPTERE